MKQDLKILEYPLHLQQVYRAMGYRLGDFPHAELAAQEVISLPLSPEIDLNQINFVVEAIKDSFANTY